MGVSKVEIMENGTARTIMDLTGDTVTPEALAEGYTAHNATGEPIHGEMKTTTVLYTEQTLTEAQKTQARSNIEAISQTELDEAIENLDECKIFYATCDTEAAIAEKAVTVFNNPNWELEIGKVIMISFSITNTASNVTLNVNGTGAYPIWYNNSEYTSNGSAYTGYAQRVTTYMFNGTHWVWITNSYDSNTTYTNVKLGHGYATCSTAAATTAKVGTLSSYTLTTGGIVAVNFTNAVPANATLNINSKGAKAIYYRGAKITADVIKAGDTATFIYNTYYHLISIDRWQDDISELREEIDDLQPKGDYALRSEIPSVPVKSVNGKTGAVVLSASDVGATTQEDVDEKLKALEIKLGQQNLSFAQGDTVEKATTWAETNGDTSKVYVFPDGLYYEYAETVVETGGVAYTNLLPTAVDTDGTTIYGGDYNGDGVNDGYKTSTRLSGSSGSPASATNELACASGFMKASDGAKVRIKGATPVSGTSSYVIAYNGSKTKLNYGSIIQAASDWSDTSKQESWCTYEDGVLTITLDSATFGTGISFFRFSAHIDENTIITVNEEIKEGGGTAIVKKWIPVGQALVPTNYDNAIGHLTQTTNAQTKAIKELQESIKNGISSDGTDALTLIRNWDKPIYERLTPFLLSEDLNITKYPQNYTESQDPDRTYRKANVQGVYDEYDALCTAHPDFVRDITNKAHGLEGATETTFGGICSDGEQYVRVYEFCEREGRHSNTTNVDYWSETKPTFIIVTGIHWEYNGVYSMLNALKLITENPELRDMRRNCRFIVIPMSNPYCFTTYNNSGGGHYNANGVEIHNNFTVEFNNAIDSTHGTAPLTEVETRYIDNAMRKYADTGVCLLTCHSNATKGSNFIWGSVATKFMCNVSMRLVDLMSNAWDSKYDNYRTAIDTQKVGNSNPQEDGDYRCGFASLSTSSGTETKQALWYGMQGINVEVYERFYLFDPEGTDVSLAVSRGAEVYVNLLRLLAVTYDHNDRDKYAPVPACKLES